MKKPVTKTTKTTPSKKQSDKHHHFPIVAIGASAGGLEAVSELLKHLSSETGMAFLYVQHLSPDHKSMLSALLSKTTSMKVQEATDKEKMMPNNLYVIPADKEMNILDGYIKITPRPEIPKVNLPIDILFSSLAATHKANVIGIILSGSATDGTRGMKSIKLEGGLTFAQDDTAKFSSMPKSAIAAGTVDFILSPKEIGQEITRLSKHPYIKSNGNATESEKEITDNDPHLKDILQLLYKIHSVDFSQYKMNTIKRRILRRMFLYKLKSLKEYSTLLREKPDEPEILYQDLLINVTAFFRNTEAHQYLKTTLLPKLLKNKKPEETLRIWVAACATGEEAYSIAIALLEIQSTKFSNIPVQIFATDLDAKAISKARIGDYSKIELEEVSPKRLQRFYTKSHNGYRVIKSVRDMCVFAKQNVLTDPPFAHVDFISCCNLLIYLDTAAQKKVITTFHYALNENGLLMLGKSESIGTSGQYFTIFNKVHKIFIRKNFVATSPLPVSTPRYNRYTPAEALAAPPVRQEIKNNIKAGANLSLDKAIDAVMLSRYMPASVIINEHLDILQFRGNTSLYISPSTGRASLNVLKMTRPEIAFELRSAISKAITTKQHVRKGDIEFKTNDVLHSVSIEVLPLKIEFDEPVLLILFSDQERKEKSDHKPAISKNITAAADRRIKRLEEQLAAARADMLAFTHEQEAFNEELQSANEEIVSSNEELQTLNEELETSKEEIESANEELNTTNQELQTRNELLNESYIYSESILATVPLPLLILDALLRVKSANKAFYRKFNVTEEETEGYRIYDLGNSQWNIPKLRELLENIIPRNSVFENFEVDHEFESIGKKVMLLNGRLIHLGSQQLILLAIADITEVRNLELEKQHAEIDLLNTKIETEKKTSDVLIQADNYIRNIFRQAPVSIVVYKGPSLIVDLINEKGLELWGTSHKKVINRPLFEISPELREQGLEKILTHVYTSGEPFIGHEFPVQYNRNGKAYNHFFNFVLNPIRDLNGTIIGITSIGTDVTKEVLAKIKIEESEKLFRFIADTMPQKVWTADAQGRRYYFNNQWLEYTGMTLEELKNDGWKRVVHPDDLSKTINHWKHSVETGEDFEVEDRKRDKEGRYKWHLSRASAYRDETGKIKMWIGTNTEVEKQKMQALEFENAVKERTRELSEEKEFSESILNTTTDLIVVCDRQMRIIAFNKACEDYFQMKKEEVLDKTYNEIFLTDKGGQSAEDMQKALQGETIHNPVFLSVASGKYYENFITPLLDSTGEVYAVVAIAHDISDNINAIEEIEKQNKDLEKMNQDLEAFTYIASHDLQEPLRKIQIFANRLLEKESENLSDSGKDYFRRMQEASLGMQTLLQDLLTFSRVSSSDQKFELTDLNTIIEEIIAEYIDVIEEKKATIETGKMPELHIIPFQFRQLIRNLMSNALKFSKPNVPPHITIHSNNVSSSEFLNGKPAHHIIFADNGIGFEQHYSEQIFQLFQRLHGKDEYPGTGIGLAIVSKIVENHNGRITATSELGKGTRFDIYIPALEK